MGIRIENPFNPGTNLVDMNDSETTAAAAVATGNPYIAMAGLGYMGAERTNQANKDIMQQQMDFQHQETSSAYQRATQDMIAAGLNPALGYTQGGAQSGQGSSIPAVDSLGKALEAGISGFNAISESDLRDAQSSALNQQNLESKMKTFGYEYENEVKKYESKKAKLKGKMFDSFMKQYELMQKKGTQNMKDLDLNLDMWPKGLQ